MYATLHLHFSGTINYPEMANHLPAPSDPSAVIAKSVFAASPEFVPRVFHSWEMPSGISIVFNEGVQKIQVHVEVSAESHNFKKLKAEAERALGVVLDASKAVHIKCDSVYVNIHAEERLICIGSRVNKFKKIGKKFLDSSLATIISSIFMCLFAYSMGLELEKSAFTGLAAIVAFLVWVAFDVFSSAKRYDYEDA